MTTTRLHRRTVLASAGAASVLPLPTAAAAAPKGGRAFRHGVASGDPLPDAVVIWTRVTPTAASTPGSGRGPRVGVRWEVATDEAFSEVVRRGRFETGPSRDHTVKVDVTGLEPDTRYYYRFRLGDQASRTGRTRTAPAEDADPENLRVAVASCANYPVGYFAAYRGIAERDDLHAVVHLGDYIYENGTAKVRAHRPDHEIRSLADYRQRHAQYKQDPDLQDAHARHPWIVTWDDHEVADDAWAHGADNHDAGEGDYDRRKARAHRAYDEWMPARLDGTAALGDGSRLYRRFRFGRLAELSLLDLRSYRSQQVEVPGDPATDDPDRTITGRPQMDWLLGGLDNDRAQWKLVGTSVMFSPLKVLDVPGRGVEAIDRFVPVASREGAYANPDQWDGYGADRRTVIEHLQEHEVTDTVFLTGDIHSGWAIDVPVDAGSYPATPTVAVEFVCTSVTSNNLDEELGTQPDDPLNDALEQAILAANLHIKYLDFVRHGFSVLDVTAERVQCDWYVVGDRTDPRTTVSWSTSYACQSGTSAVVEADGPAS